MPTGLQQLMALRTKPTVVRNYTFEEIHDNIAYYSYKLDMATEAYHQSLELSKSVSVESAEYKIIMEGVIDSVVSGIKSVINWVINLIKKFISWVGDLFGGGNDKKAPTDNEVTEAISAINKAKNSVPTLTDSQIALFEAYDEQYSVFQELEKHPSYTVLVPEVKSGSFILHVKQTKTVGDVIHNSVVALVELARLVKFKAGIELDITAKTSSSFRKYSKTKTDTAYGEITTRVRTTELTATDGILKTEEKLDPTTTLIAKSADVTKLGLSLVTSSIGKLEYIDKVESINKKDKAELQTLQNHFEAIISAIDSIVEPGAPTKRDERILNLKTITQVIIKTIVDQINDYATVTKNANQLRTTIVKISKLDIVQN